MGQWLEQLVTCSSYSCVADQLISTVVFIVVILAVLLITVLAIAAMYNRLKGKNTPLN